LAATLAIGALLAGRYGAAGMVAAVLIARGAALVVLWQAARLPLANAGRVALAAVVLVPNALPAVAGAGLPVRLVMLVTTALAFRLVERKLRKSA
jgi:hypothetical protein